MWAVDPAKLHYLSAFDPAMCGDVFQNHRLLPYRRDSVRPDIARRVPQLTVHPRAQMIDPAKMGDFRTRRGTEQGRSGRRRDRERGRLIKNRRESAPAPGSWDIPGCKRLSIGDNLVAMVRPERRVVLAGESPVLVSAGAPGGRLPPSGVSKPLKERGANLRAATTSERCSHVIVSAERRSRRPSRSYRGKGYRQHPGQERMLDLSGSQAVTRWERATRNRREPTWQPCRAKTGRIRPDG